MVLDHMTSLGLFDTLVPVASILTVSCLTLLILPRHQTFGLFLLVWWLMVVAISLQNTLFTQPNEWNRRDDWRGLAVLICVPIGILGALYMWFQTSPSFRNLILRKIPLWCMFAIHAYRLDGLSIVWPLIHGSIPKYLGLQTILLDVLIGTLSIPLIWETYRNGVGALAGGSWQREGVWLWNSLGLYDLVSAYLVLVMNFAGVGGSLVTDPPPRCGRLPSSPTHCVVSRSPGDWDPSSYVDLHRRHHSKARQYLASPCTH